QTRATTQFGGQPTVNMVHATYRKKFTATHEYGHIQTAIVPGIPLSAADADYSGSGGDPGTHSWLSIEWQSNAVVEAYGNLYSTWIWNNPSGAASWYADVGNLDRIRVPYLTVKCTTSLCGAGVANERDWTGALFELQQQ